MSSSDEEGESDSSGEGVAFDPTQHGTQRKPEPVVKIVYVDEEEEKHQIDEETEEDSSHGDEERRQEEAARRQAERAARKEARMAARLAKKEATVSARREKEIAMAKEEAAQHAKEAAAHRAEHADKVTAVEAEGDEEYPVLSPRTLATMENGQLVVQIVRATGLPKATNYYAQAKLLAPKKQFLCATDVIKKTADPDWSFDGKPRIFNVLDAANSVLKVQVMHKLVGLIDSNTGEVVIDVKTLRPSVPYTLTMPLTVKQKRKGREEKRVAKGAKAKDLGQVTVNVMFFNINERFYGTEFTYPVHTMIKKKNVEAVLTLLDNGDNCKDTQNPDGDTCLHLSCEHDLPEVTEQLIAKGFGAKQANKKNQYPVHLAAGHSAKSLVALLAHDSDLDLATADEENGWYPIHHAANNDNVEAIEHLLRHGASVDQVGSGFLRQAPLVLALTKNCDGAVEALAENGADIFLKGSDDQCAVDFFFSKKDKLGGGGAILIADGADRGITEVTKQALLDAKEAVDPREFLMIKDGFTERFDMQGSRISNVFNMRTQQWTVSVDEPTTVQAIINLLGSQGLQNEKVAFVVTKHDVATVYRHPSAIMNVHCYADEDPVEIQMEPGSYYTFIPYSKHPEIKGAFSIVLRGKAGCDVDIVELRDWNYNDEVMSGWTEENAIGAQPAEGWEKNPNFALRVNRKRSNIHVAVMMSQTRISNDIIPFQVMPYSNYIGFHVYKDEKYTDKLCDSNSSWLNCRDVWTYFTIDGPKTPKLIIIPTSFKPAPGKAFKITIYCSNKLRVNALTPDMKDIPKEEKPEPEKKKKRVKKKRVKKKKKKGGTQVL